MKVLSGISQLSLPFKGRAGVGMGLMAGDMAPIPLPASPLKGEGRRVSAFVRSTFLAAGLALSAGLASAAAGVAKPDIVVDPDKGSCIAPPAEMRRNHMDMLKHQRDKTLRAGERGAKVSLNGCIDCHAGKHSGSVTGSRQEFCESCHAYAAVKLDCFECHQSKSAKLTAGGKQ